MNFGQVILFMSLMTTCQTCLTQNDLKAIIFAPAAAIFKPLFAQQNSFADLKVFYTNCNFDTCVLSPTLFTKKIEFLEENPD